MSAGAAFGCNYKSRQIGRAIRYNTRFAKDSRYSGMKSLLLSGDYFNAKFGYHVVPYKYDIFDIKAFEENPLEFIIVCTDVTTGEAVKVVKVQGHKLLDGGVSDSIPLQYFESIGYKRNVVILTQPLGYQKEHNRLMALM